MSFIVSKRNICIINTLLLSLFVSYFVAIRPEDLAPDYHIYLTMYENPDARLSELTFLFFQNIYTSFDNGFYYLLFTYAVLSIFTKIYALKDQNSINVIIFSFFYIISFFPLWELTQIRISLSVGLFFIFLMNNKWRILPVLSILFHYSMVFFVIPYYFYLILKRNIFYYIFSMIFICFLTLLVIKYTPYAVYDVLENQAEYNIFSIKNLLILLIICYNYKYSYFDSRYVEIATILAISSCLFYFILGSSYPTIVIRLMDINLFLIISSIIFLPNSYQNLILKIVLVVPITIFYFYMNFIGESSLINTEVLIDFFKSGVF